MRHLEFRQRRVLWFLPLVFCLGSTTAGFQGGAGGQGGQGGQGGGIPGVAQGVYVDADGVLRTVMMGERGDALAKLRRDAVVARAGGDVARKSPMRKISLTRLAKAVAASIQAGQRLSDEMRFLAGLQQIQHLFVYPEENDVVIAGPAEGWEMDEAGRVLGQTTKRPVVRLDDLVVALRTFPPSGEPNTVVGCTINQTAEGVQRLNAYMASLGPSIDRRRVNAALVQGVRDALGLQNIEIWGVPEDSRLGLVLVEADYRMKLIGIGLENPRVRGLKSYVEMMGSGDAGANKLHRWWFVPSYDAIVESEEGDAFELRGQRVKLLAADDKLQVTGQVERKNTASATSQRFAGMFSKHYPELAKINPIFAELQNAFDLIMLAAILQDRGLSPLAAGQLNVFYNATAGLPRDTVPTPKQVESVVNAKWIGTKLAMPVGGGVIVEPSQIAKEKSKNESDGAKLREQRTASRAKTAEQWWWD